MTKQQVKWAEQHDWFRTAFEDLDGTWAVVTRPAWEGDDQTLFTDFQALRAWAGY